MAKKAKKIKARKTVLDQIVARLRTILRRRTTDVVAAGNELIKAREHFASEHGEWQEWLAENFDLDVRTAQNYCAAAKYVARKSETVSDFDPANLAPTLLYKLATGRSYNEQEEAAILAAANEGRRVDATRAEAICDALVAADDGDDDDADGGSKDGDEAAAAEAEAILDGPPPDLPPPPNPTLTNFALQAFDEAIGVLRPLVSKQATQFAKTIHSGDDLKNVEDLIRNVIAARSDQR